jgi:hypothetical protein
LCFAQDEVSQQGLVLEGKESVLRKLERQRTHFEAKAALQEHQQKAVVSRLEASCAAMAAEVSFRFFWSLRGVKVCCAIDAAGDLSCVACWFTACAQIGS